MRLESKKTSLLVMVIAAIVLVIVVVATAIPLLQKNPQTTTTNQTQMTVDNNSLVVEGRGLRVTLNYSSLDLKLGDRFLYAVELENVNSPSRLSLVRSAGIVMSEAYNETGGLVMRSYGVYAIGPPLQGPPQADFTKGKNWPISGFWDTGSVPNDIPSPIKPKAGNYIFSVKVYYYNLDLGAEEELGLQTSLRISE